MAASRASQPYHVTIVGPGPVVEVRTGCEVTTVDRTPEFERRWTVPATVDGLVLAVVPWMAIAAPETRGRELDRVTGPSGDPVTART
ncbi:hypothetical protein ABZ912_62545 [Nonomuraea angiospora]|uniref:hypothetical protein n=1 Tax=Nonomuraea angiospora TaxID=46172 RepID=UPI0033D51D30